MKDSADTRKRDPLTNKGHYKSNPTGLSTPPNEVWFEASMLPARGVSMEAGRAVLVSISVSNSIGRAQTKTASGRAFGPSWR
jgi:hypothetical protein